MIREWVTLLRLAHKRSDSHDNYQRFQTYQGELVLEYLRRQGVGLENTKVLDLGCGHGGYSRAMVEAGAHVVSVDLRRSKAELPTPVVTDAMQLPFACASFPVIFCASLIEHVSDQK